MPAKKHSAMYSVCGLQIIPSKSLVRDWTRDARASSTMNSGATMNAQLATVDQIQLAEVASFTQLNFK